MPQSYPGDPILMYNVIYFSDTYEAPHFGRFVNLFWRCLPIGTGSFRYFYDSDLAMASSYRTLDDKAIAAPWWRMPVCLRVCACVLVPPQWTAKPRDVAASLGSAVVIPCSADGFPTPDIKWKKKGGLQATHDGMDPVVLFLGPRWNPWTLPELYMCAAPLGLQ